nr:MAG TPA: hypothetical protein [Caudoviricetes sp.]
MKTRRWIYGFASLSFFFLTLFATECFKFNILMYYFYESNI